jgi:hypothetical protein
MIGLGSENHFQRKVRSFLSAWQHNQRKVPIPMLPHAAAIIRRSIIKKLLNFDGRNDKRLVLLLQL